MTFDSQIWSEFEIKAKTSFPKRYAHFDRPFKIDLALSELKSLLQDSSGRGIARHSFLPFLKIILKTPRFRYEEELSAYALKTKERPISFASHFDALIISYFDLLLKRRYQDFIRSKGFSDSVLAYRDDLNGLCNIQFAKEIFEQVRHRSKPKDLYTAIGFDIKGYFDSIPHEELKKQWCTVLEVPKLDANTFAIFKTLTAYSYTNSDSLKKHFNYSRVPKGKCLLDVMPEIITEASRRHDIFNYLRSRKLIAQNKAILKITDPDHPLGFGELPIGIPQGSPISATLSNVYLLQFDMHMHNFCNNMNCIYRRYCDDILIVCKTKDKAYLHNRLCQQIDFHGLTIQNKKTEIIDFRFIDNKLIAFDGNPKAISGRRKKLQYLGFEFDGQRVYLRPGSLSTYFRKMKAGIRNTLIKAYGKKSQEPKLLTKDLFESYSHTGRNNFVAYAYRAASINYGKGRRIKQGFDSPQIRNQLSRHFQILLNEIKQENEQRHALKKKEVIYKLKLGKKVKMPAKRLT
ncbi:Reverse transcriptase (RNA-dependent DNA polymerase) [Mucilaginibacter pineti]|uniref:Reverse transcriptase (RNA-dependent DNA polymerase) n=1 Tax=Mucilaginibacter pineti TaxID=1391627 RepID=A0A1G7GKQ6_9SPHI|nr:reverse transcriptase domain-containing protein [Mucilaginibacter pineti]SDE88705.1 Reverse transcriptase (RNA-dependent DNA polymerase) [Mucilaginibacter pineti]